MHHDTALEARVRQKFLALKDGMSERMRQRWAGAEAESIGYGGIALVSRATGIARRIVRAGRNVTHQRRRDDFG